MSSKSLIILTSLFLGLFVSSTILNFLLYNRAKQYYLELNSTRLDPFGLRYNFKVSEGSNNIDESIIRIVLFGDSRVADWSTPRINGYEFINRGIGSQTSIQTWQRFPAHVQPLKPDIVFIQVGINDLKTIPLFPQNQEEIIRNCQNNIKQIIEDSRKLGATVIISTIIPAGEIPLERKAFWSDDIAKAVEVTNAYLKTLERERVIIFDAFQIIADDTGKMQPQYRADELHLNAQGYEALNQELIKKIGQISNSLLKEF